MYSVLYIFTQTIIKRSSFSVTEEIARYILDCLRGMCTPHEGEFVAIERIHNYLKPKMKSLPQDVYVPLTAALIKKMMAKAFPSSLCVSTEDNQSKESYPLMEFSHTIYDNYSHDL